jgi:hypothetical protein
MCSHEQLALRKALAAVRAGHAVATEQLGLGERRHDVEQIGLRPAVRRDDRMRVDQRLAAARDVEAAAQRGQRNGFGMPSLERALNGTQMLLGEHAGER